MGTLGCHDIRHTETPSEIDKSSQKLLSLTRRPHAVIMIGICLMGRLDREKCKILWILDLTLVYLTIFCTGTPNCAPKDSNKDVWCKKSFYVGRNLPLWFKVSPNSKFWAMSLTRDAAKAEVDFLALRFRHDSMV